MIRCLTVVRPLTPENGSTNEQIPSQEYVKSYSMDIDNYYVCIMMPDIEQMIQQALLNNQASMSSYGRLYLLCQTIHDIVPGFNLLETRVISRGITGWPVAMATLYKEGTKEGIVQHMKIVTRLCSTAGENFYSPKVQCTVHLLTKTTKQLILRKFKTVSGILLVNYLTIIPTRSGGEIV